MNTTQIEIGGTVYEVGDEGRIELAACCCHACAEATQLLPGHFQCWPEPDGFVEAEQRGEVFRSLEFAGWYWFVATN